MQMDRTTRRMGWSVLAGFRAWATPAWVMVLATGLCTAGCAAARMEAHDVPLTQTPPPAAAALAPAQPVPSAPMEAEKSAQVAPVSPAAPLPTAAPATDRQIIYTATLQIVVPDISTALSSVQQTTRTLGGYLDRLSEDSITVRVPVGRFQDLISAAEKLGAVTGRNVQAQDITEEMHDLQIRLDTEMQVRQRLLALLDKADKTADAIKVEQELERVVQTVEQLKGKIRFYQDQVAFSTVTVKFNSPVPQQVIQQEVPIPWVRELAAGMTDPNAIPCADRNHADGGPKFELPKSYIRCYGQDDLAIAMSADETYIRVERHENYQGGDLQFWSALARRVLTASRSIAVTNESDVKLRTHATAHLIQGTRQIGGKSYGYLLALVSRKHEVHALEAWGPAEAMARDLEGLRKAVESLDLNP